MNANQLANLQDKFGPIDTKETLGDIYEVYFRREPEHPNILVPVIRKRHDIIKSEKLKKYDRCMSRNLEGVHESGYGPKEDTILVRSHFAEVAHKCSQED